jgi:hypothetical protein
MGLHILPAERIRGASRTGASSNALGSFDAAAIGVGNNGIQPMSQTRSHGFGDLKSEA